MMKTPSSYIAKMMGALAKRFPSTIIRYAFLENDGMHVVDLTGHEIDTLKEETWAVIYNKWVDEFEAKFSGESLLMAKEGDFVRVTAEMATQTVAPKTLASTIPDAGTIVYTWADKLGEYIYEMQTFLPIVIPIPGNDNYKPKHSSNRRYVGSESSFSFDSVPATTGTESFCPA